MNHRVFKTGLPFIAIIFWVVSCSPPAPAKDVIDDSPVEIESKMKFRDLKDEDVEIIVIDQCEYIVYQHNAAGSSHGYGFMAHKGNCKNPIHLYNGITKPPVPDSTVKKLK